MKKNRENYSGVPLGGIGAGKIEFCPNGKFSNVTINNNWDVPICDGRAKKVREVNPEGLPFSFLANYVEGVGARVLKTNTFKEFKAVSKKDIRYEGKFPIAEVKYSPFGRVDMSLTAFSPLMLDNDGKDNYKNSSLPVAVFSFLLTNNSKKTKTAAVCFSWETILGHGGYVQAEINDARGNYAEYKEDIYPGLWFGTINKRNSKPKNVTLCIDDSGSMFGSTVKKIDPRVEGNYSLLVKASKKIKTSYYGGPIKAFWENFSKKGILPNQFKGMRYPSGILSGTCKLKPKEQVRITFALSWYMPNLLANNKPEVNYGHAYENWFKDSHEVAIYALNNYDNLLNSTRSWQKVLENSNLPKWFTTKLMNDLFPVYSNSWYTKDYLFTVNESPTNMAGCAGTIDQRAASNSIYTMCLPKLSKSELTIFSNQQIRKDDKFRFGTHWNAKTGKFDLKLDRLGAIRHDVGWDHLDGGGLGHKMWSNLHWPDLPTVYVLQCYEYFIWTDDRRFLNFVYPKVKLALEFEKRVDQDNDGIADLWGSGSNTYDSDAFPYFGASPFIATLYLAALKTGIEMAKLKRDFRFINICQKQFKKTQNSLYRKLWDKKKGYFISWLDKNYKNWNNGERKRNEKSESCIIPQIAGQWFANLFNLGDIIDKEKIESAISAITNKNNKIVKYCPANEVSVKGKKSSSWPYYAETYYACNAIYENEKDAGFECFKKINDAIAKVNKSPWDAQLYWKGKNNDEPDWGNWYMTNPASWFALLAFAGFCLNLPKGELVIAPSIPKQIGNGKVLRNLPIFMPHFWAKVDYELSGNKATLKFEITKKITMNPLKFNNFITKIPRGWTSYTKLIFKIDGKVINVGNIKLNMIDRKLFLPVSFSLDKHSTIEHILLKN